MPSRSVTRPSTTSAGNPPAAAAAARQDGDGPVRSIYVVPPFPQKVGQANTVGAKLVNAGATMVFSILEPGRNEIEMIDAASLNLPDSSTSFVPLPGTQSLADSVVVNKDQNTTVEVTIQPGTDFVITPK